MVLDTDLIRDAYKRYQDKVQDYLDAYPPAHPTLLALERRAWAAYLAEVYPGLTTTENP